MYHLTSLTVLTGYLVTLTGCSYQHNAIFKSLASTDRECILHLRDGTCGKGDCTVRCRGLLARFWQDSAGLPTPTINRFYCPDGHDCGYRDRTQQCLWEISALIPAEDVCRRANCCVSCYDDQYGQVDRAGLSFVPFTDLQHRRVVGECEAILGLTNERHCRDVKCLLRCFLIREGLYTDDCGPDLQRISVQGGSCYKGEQYRQRVAECVRNLQLQRLDRCELAYRVASDCLSDGLLPIFLNVTGDVLLDNCDRSYKCLRSVRQHQLDGVKVFQ